MMRLRVIACGIAAFGAGAAMAQVAAPSAPATAPAGKSLADKLINNPATASWSVFGAGQTNAVLPHDGPQGYPATRVTVAAKGASPWDAGAVSPIGKPVAAGDTVLVAVYLRAPMLKDGETTPVSYFGLNEGAAPYDIVAQGAASVTNQWKLFYASGKAAKPYAADAVAVGIHLATDKHVLDLGPVRVFDLGQDVDPARLPKNG